MSGHQKTDEELKAEFLARKGVTNCPPATAAILGEITPGWRRNAERRADNSENEAAFDRHQRKLRNRQIYP